MRSSAAAASKRLGAFFLAVVMSLACFTGTGFAEDEQTEDLQVTTPEQAQVEVLSEEQENLAEEQESEIEVAAVDEEPETATADAFLEEQVEEPAPETEEPIQAAASQTTVQFNIVPETATLRIFARTESGEEVDLAPEDDGSYLLNPGLYYFTASEEGYEPVAETELLVSESSEPVLVTVTMNEISLAIPEQETEPQKENNTTVEGQIEAAGGEEVVMMATVEQNWYAWDQSRINTYVTLKGSANIYQDPAAYDANINRILGTMSTGYNYRTMGIGKNASGDYYYSINGGGISGYVPAWLVVPNYDSDPLSGFGTAILDANEENQNVFTKDYKLHGTIRNPGGDAVSTDSITISIRNSSGTEITGGNATVNTYNESTITSSSAISQKVDFSKLSVGQSYTMTVKVNYTDHAYPNGRTAVREFSFQITEECYFTLQAGSSSTEVSVTASGLRVPTSTMTYGEKYTLKGTIKATGGNLSKVSAYVYPVSDTSLSSPVTGAYENIDRASYSIQGSKLDSNCKFATLAEGDYVYILSAEAGGKSFQLNKTAFTVVKPSYTVQYWANEGQYRLDGTSTNYLSQEKAYGSTVILLENIPKRSHYTFLGYDTSKSATAVQYSPGDTYSANKNLDLYAVWRPHTYTLRYILFEGTGCPEPQNYTYGDYPVISSIVPTREHYRFTGWKASYGSLYQPGDVFTEAPTEDGAEIAVTAQWEVTTYYDVTFDPNGGVGTVQTIHMPYNTFKTPNPMFYRSGYDFVGWASSPDATEPDFSGNPTSNMTLYAVWKEAESFTVKVHTVLVYTSGGGSRAAGNSSACAKSFCLTVSRDFSTTEHGKTIRELGWDLWDISCALPESYYNGLTILPDSAWISSGAAEFNGSVITPDTIVDHSFDCTFVPVYNTSFTDAYYISLRPNGGNGVSELLTKSKDVPLNLPAQTPTRSDNAADSYLVTLNAQGGNLEYDRAEAERTVSYNFTEWNTAADGSGTAYVPGAVYAENADLTLYAQWSSSVTTSPITLSTPTREGFVFVGWAENAAGSDQIYQAGTSYTPNGNTELYAIWSSRSFSVVYNADGGSGIPDAQTKLYDQSLTLSTQVPTRADSYVGTVTVTLNPGDGTVMEPILTAEQKNSYSFTDWNTASDGSGTSYLPGAVYADNASVILHAQWDVQTSTEEITLPTSTREGYLFLGWAKTSDASTAEYQPGSQYSTDEDVTLYAVWSIRSFTVTYHANEGNGIPDAQTKLYDQNLTLSAQVPTRADSFIGTVTVTLNPGGGTVAEQTLTTERKNSYSFTEWNTEEDGSGTSYSAGGTYTPNSSVTLYAQWTSSVSVAPVSLPTPSRDGFTFNGWSTSNTATSGTTGNYTPAGNVTLYAIWTENQPAVRFTDVSNPSDYFYTPVYWAVDNGITSGTSATTFSPYNPCTRGQVMSFLWKANGSPVVGGSNPFTDVKESDYFYNAVLWAVSRGITAGTSATTFGPYNTCTRAQVMTFLWKANGSPVVGGGNPFMDVTPGDYFYNAVLWAVANGITNGTSSTTFGPYNTCTRGQVMTFLYKAMN